MTTSKHEHACMCQRPSDGGAVLAHHRSLIRWPVSSEVVAYLRDSGEVPVVQRAYGAQRISGRSLADAWVTLTALDGVQALHGMVEAQRVRGLQLIKLVAVAPFGRGEVGIVCDDVEPAAVERQVEASAVEHLVELGADSYLTKPLDVRLFFGVLSDLLAARPAVA